VGICQLVEIAEDSFGWKLAEPLAIRVVKEVVLYFRLSNKVVLDIAIKGLFDIMQLLGSKASEKGKVAEILTAAQILQSWNGKTLANIGVITHNIEKSCVPMWMSNVVFTASKYGTSQQFGFANDLQVIESIKNGSLKQNVLLLPENQMRPDMLWLHFQDNKWFAVVVSQKLYSSVIDEETFQQNESSTDLSLVYYKADGTEINKNFQSKCEQFHQITDEAFRSDPTKLGGVLRVHVLLPSVAKSCNVLDLAADTQVTVHITKDNVQSLFPDLNFRQLLSLATKTVL